MLINPAKTAVGNLLALIIASNERFSVVGEEALQVESVTALETPDADGNDTATVVSAQGYSHDQAFAYSRAALAATVPGSPPVITVTVGDEGADVLEAVAATLGLVASELILVDESGTLAGASEAIIDANVTSLLYNSDPFTVPLEWESADINSLVDNPSIGGFSQYVGEDV